VVCGDFNDTPVSYAYRKVRGDMKDAFVESGWGVSNTYNGGLPSLRIDYILCDRKFDVSDYRRDRIYLSDHFPVRCRLSIE
jgi:endonuclease/exonuclease/phosphatase family metal-dependent hydrolase